MALVVFIVGIFNKSLQVIQFVIKYNHRKGGNGYSLCTKVHKKGVATMTTSEVLQLLELLAVVIFGILSYLKHQ